MFFGDDFSGRLFGGLSSDLLSTQEGLSGIDVPHDASELSRLFAIHDRGTAAGGGAARLPTSVITPDTLAATLKRPVLAGTDMVR